MLPPHNIILFELVFNTKFPLLRLLQFLSGLKSNIKFKASEFVYFQHFIESSS